MAEINGLEYGITFGEKHSITDWGLYLKSRPVIDPPEVKTSYVEIPGADGSIDLTEALGGVYYKMRDGEFSFLVIGGRAKWQEKYSEILAYLHGQEMKVIFDETPDYYYLGRLSVDSWTSDKVTATIKIKGTFYPHKYKVSDDSEDGF